MKCSDSILTMVPSAEREILNAWRTYRRVEKYGLAFGKVCHVWQERFSERGQRIKGRGVVPILEQLKIPVSTAYFWIHRYKETIGLKDVRPMPHSPSPLPDGVYRVLLVDPPWRYDGNLLPFNYGPATRHYPTMPVEEICQMKLPAIASDAVLFLWVPVPHLENGLTVLRAWGFDYKSQFVWDKVRHNYGFYNSVRHEDLLIATRGSCLPGGVHVDAGGVERTKLEDSVQSIERTEHSRKPEQFRQIIDRMYPTGPRIELFARGPVPKNWHGWGDEFQQHAAAD